MPKFLIDLPDKVLNFVLARLPIVKQAFGTIQIIRDTSMCNFLIPAPPPPALVPLEQACQTQTTVRAA